MLLQQLLDRLAGGEFLENQLDGNAGIQRPQTMGDRRPSLTFTVTR